MSQWPEGGSKVTLSLAKIWSTVSHPTRIAELCSNGLHPKPHNGLTTFYLPGEISATELTCSLKYKPGASYIDGSRLVAIALCSLFLKLNPIEVIAFCKSKWEIFSENFFWVSVKLYLEHSITMPPNIREAVKIENPEIRNFVLSAWNRLCVRSTLTYVDQFLSSLVSLQWNKNSKAWGADICRHLNLLQTPFVITTADKGDFIIEGVPIKVSKRDKVALILLMLFAKRKDGLLPWGEKSPEPDKSPCFDVFSEFDEIYNPKRCWVHECISLSLDNNPHWQSIV